MSEGVRPIDMEGFHRAAIQQIHLIPWSQRNEKLKSVSITLHNAAWTEDYLLVRRVHAENVVIRK